MNQIDPISPKLANVKETFMWKIIVLKLLFANSKKLKNLLFSNDTQHKHSFSTSHSVVRTVNFAVVVLISFPKEMSNIKEYVSPETFKNVIIGSKIFCTQDHVVQLPKAFGS